MTAFECLNFAHATGLQTVAEAWLQLNRFSSYLFAPNRVRAEELECIEDLCRFGLAQKDRNSLYHIDEGITLEQGINIINARSDRQFQFSDVNEDESENS